MGFCSGPASPPWSGGLLLLVWPLWLAAAQLLLFAAQSPAHHLGLVALAAPPGRSWADAAAPINERDADWSMGS